MSIVQRQNIFEPAQESPNSTANRTLFQAQESELVGGQEARIRLPHSTNTFIDTSQSYLQFDLGAKLVGTGFTTPTTGLDLKPRVNMCDLGAESAIQSILVYCGGRLINQFNNYYKICALLRNSNVSVYNSQGVSLAKNSTSNDYRCAHLGTPIPTTGTDTDTSLTFPTQTVGFPLLGLLGSPNKMLPMGFLSSDIEIQIRFADTHSVFWTPYGGQATTPTSITHSSSTLNISNVSFNAKVVTVSDATFAEIYRMSRDDEGIMSWSGSCWSLDSETTLTPAELTAGTKINKVLSGFRYKSLKTIATTGFVPRGSTSLTDCPETACLGYFGKKDGIQYSIAGINYPQTPATNIAQACASTNATFSNVSFATSNNLLDSASCAFNQRPDALGGGGGLGNSIDVCPATVCCINLEDSMVSGNAGTNTTAIQVVAKVGVDAEVDSTVGLQVAYFANYDVLYSVNVDGILSCSF